MMRVLVEVVRNLNNATGNRIRDGEWGSEKCFVSRRFHLAFLEKSATLLPSNIIHIFSMQENQNPEATSNELDPIVVREGDGANVKLQEFIDFFRDIIIILVLVFLVIRPYVGAPFQISGSSMEKSYHDGEFILVNKFSYADF